MSKTDLKKRLEKAIDYYKTELARLHIGRVTPALLDTVEVNVYDSTLSVKEVGTITVLDSQTLQITPWDKNTLESIANGIEDSDLQLKATINNDAVIVPVPSLTEERRKELTHLVSSKMEDARGVIRNIRQDAMKSIDASFDNKEFGEDEKFSLREDFEDIVKEYANKVSDLGESKKTDIMTI